MNEIQTQKEVMPCKVVVIDDEEKEASALIRALSKRDVPVFYFNGRKTELPEDPITGVRMVFLDMKLEGMERAADETLASSLMNLLKKIVSNRNGPYLIFAWTKHDNLLKEFQEQLKERGEDLPKPHFLVNMEKNECMSDGEIDFEKVSNKLLEKISELSIFRFFMNWEKIVGSSRDEVISLISSMVTKLDVKEWRTEIGEILYQVAKAQSGRTLEETTVTITNSAMKVLNSILEDCIEKRVGSTKTEFLKCPDRVEISVTNKAIINTKIHLREFEEVEVAKAPGDLYLLEDFDDLCKYVDYLPADVDSLQNEFFDSNPSSGQCKLCMLEITPICDYAQGKWRATRLLIGLVVPVSLVNRIKKKADFLYRTPLLLLNDSPSHLVFNFYYMIAIPFDKLSKLKPRYQLRIGLLSDIQHKFSTHISRRGIIELR